MPFSRRRNAGKKSRAGEGPERMRRYRLGEIEADGGQCVEGGGTGVGVPGVTEGLRPPLGGHDPQEVGGARCRWYWILAVIQFGRESSRS